jgi:hypothetical protein
MLKAGLAILGSLAGGPGSSGVQLTARTPVHAAVPSALALIENHGQWDTPAELVGHLGSLDVRLEKDAVVLQLRQGPQDGCLVRLEFEHASDSSSLSGRQPRPEHYGYFLGDDPARWQKMVPAWGQGLYEDVWPGVDLIVRDQNHRLKYDLTLAPQADLKQVVFRVSGHQGMLLGTNGELVIETAAGRVEQPAPATFELLPFGESRPISARFRLLDGQRYGFEVDARDPTCVLLIDPGLIWSTYLGSSSASGVGDRLQAIALGPNGESIVAGIADWGDFPVTPGAYASPFVAGEKAFVSMFDPTGSSLIYSCIVGGNTTLFPYTRAMAVDVDASRRVVVVGWTGHTDFPTTPGALDTHKNNSTGQSGFVFMLEPDGSDLVYSTFLEGSQNETAMALAVTPQGAAIVGGNSDSQDFPVTPGAFDTVHGPGNPGFICRLNPAGDLLEWSTFLGGAAAVNAIRLDAQGSVFACGTTNASFPVTPGAFDTSHNSPLTYPDGFVARLTSDGKNLQWATYLGGSAEERLNALAIDPLGSVVVTGATKSLNYPVTSGAIQTTHSAGSGNNYDIFVTKLNALGSGLVYSTYLGGASWYEEGFGIASDSAGIATLGGLSSMLSVPATAGAYDSFAYDYEGFVARLSPDGKRLYYWSYVGGQGTDQFNALAMDPLGIVTVGGYTTDSYPVTPGCFDPLGGGGQTDGMVTRMDLLPAGAVPYGTSTPSCHGPLVIGVTKAPAAGSSDFALYASGAPAGSLGVLGLSAGLPQPGYSLAGLTLWIGLGMELVVLPALAQSIPYAEVAVPIPSGIAGLQVSAQFVFRNTAACGGAGTFSASNALTITVQ